MTGLTRQRVTTRPTQLSRHQNPATVLSSVTLVEHTSWTSPQGSDRAPITDRLATRQQPKVLFGTGAKRPTLMLES